jgi:signal transduction histidine kinase
MESSDRPKWSFVLDEPIRLLVVDDDPILREFAVVHLSSPVATVETAADGVEALERLRREAFDIVLADIEMPNLDGFGLVREIRADPTLGHLPVVMVTGREDIMSIDRAYEVGATSFVTKPVNWRQISHQLRYVMRTSRMEAALRAERDRAELAATLKANMLTVMRHELRTPLNSIIGFAELMSSRAGQVAAPLSQSQYALYIAEAGHRLLRTVTELMHYAQMRSGEFELQEEVYSLERLVMEAVDNARASAPFSVDLTFVEDQPDLICDREQVVRLLRNLLHNGAVHGGGRLNLRVAVDDRSGGLAIEVADDGPGIDDASLTRCLEAFWQADLSLARNTEGLGLGLPISKAIMDLHGGSIELVPREAGALVRVSFPPARLVPRQSVLPERRARFA